MDEIKFKSQLINIKLQTSKENKKEAYIKLFSDLLDQSIHVGVGENRHMILLSKYPQNTDSETKYIYGKIGKGFYFDKPTGVAIDLASKESEKVVTNQDKIIHATITEYVFIPDAHRFCLILGGNITLLEVFKFLNEALHTVKDKEDIVKLEIENEPEIVDEILTAKKVHQLSYKISYTNDDFNKAVAAQLDARLKKCFVGTLEVNAKADNNGEMNIRSL